jgi:serine/threonine-protein kinase
MGVVREGAQHALGRTVAVKSIRGELSDHHGAVVALLREAQLTGSLEHPGVVPVHDVLRDETGAPMIVLKKISGVVWSDLLQDPERLRPLLDVGDPLEWHLRTLMQIATVVHFGHTRRVVHRDLKPANVMIGEHGEVYLLDWGIAGARTRLRPNT